MFTDLFLCYLVDTTAYFDWTSLTQITKYTLKRSVCTCSVPCISQA